MAELNGDTKLSIKATWALIGITIAIVVQWAVLDRKADSVKQELAPMREDLADMKGLLKSIDDRGRTDTLRFEARITAIEVELRSMKK